MNLVEAQQDKKVILATPAPISHRTAEENLGLGYLAAMLRKNAYSVEIVDGWLEGLTPDQIAKRILDSTTPLYVGFSAYRSNMEKAMETVKILRNKGFCRPVVAGGFGPSFHPSEFLKAGFDVVIRGEGAKRCPCGRTSFRIHSITPDGAVYVSPCVYLHDYKSPLDLLKYPLVDIINSDQFKVFRQRNAHPELVEGCNGCPVLDKCGGGCIARSYLYKAHETGIKTMRAQDPYCPMKFNPREAFPQNPKLSTTDRKLVHIDYLCTWIGKPKPQSELRLMDQGKHSSMT